MILTQAPMQPNAELLADNAAMAERLVAQGADLDLVKATASQSSVGFGAANISKVECVLIAISEKFGGGEVSWEYQSRCSAPQERVN